MTDSVRFFMGANTAEGFKSLFDKMYDETADKAVLIKGGAGTGKSTLMKKIAASAEKENKGLVEYIHCSSDPDSLDAVIFRSGKNCIIDGTSPHLTDPKWPGAVDRIINLGDHWDDALLRKSKNKIIELNKRKKKIYGEVYRYIEAVSDACSDINTICEQFIKYDKMNSAIEKLKEELSSQSGKKGSEIRRILYTVTPKGYTGYDRTLLALSDEITVIDDDYFIADIYMNKIKAVLLSLGYEIYVCINTLSYEKGIDAIIIPKLNRSFVVSNFIRKYEGEYSSRVDLKQFTKNTELKNFKARIAFNKKLALEMLLQAVSKLNEIRDLHRILEDIYISAMDFEAINSLSHSVFDYFELQE